MARRGARDAERSGRDERRGEERELSRNKAYNNTYIVVDGVEWRADEGERERESSLSSAYIPVYVSFVREVIQRGDAARARARGEKSRSRSRSKRRGR